MNAMNISASPLKTVMMPPHTNIEIRAQFFRRSTLTLVKMPKIARQANSTIMAMTMDLAKGGIPAELGDWGNNIMPTIAVTALRRPNRLARMPTTAAAMTELDGPEAFMV